MAMPSSVHELTRYLERADVEAKIPTAPAPNLALVVVIPCRQEPDIIALLEHLQSLAPDDPAIEVLVVLNHERGAPAVVAQAHARDLQRIRQWRRSHCRDGFQVHALAAFAMPPRHAGVGLARRIGMDEAVARFARLGRGHGIIASLDADCRLEQGYFQALLQAFADASAHAVILPYAHRLDACIDARHRQAIVGYELFLRYIELGWRWAGLPYAFTAIGSCFAVRADAYARHSGMNRRKAGEDFYFLHKLARERPLLQLAGPCVHPSPRMSSRTPFGTGQAVRDWYAGGASFWPVAAPRVFDELRDLGQHVSELFAADPEAWLAARPARLREFLVASGFADAVAGMQRHAASAHTFRRRFFVWFDGLKAWRYVQQEATSVPVAEAVAVIAGKLGWRHGPCDDEAMLHALRRFMRQLASSPRASCRVRRSQPAHREQR